MVEFGNELIIESYKIPWLIWIQLLVMVLLIILLFFGFPIFTSDSSTSSSSSGDAAAPPLTTRLAVPPAHPNNTSANRMIKVEDQRATRDAGTSRGSIREEDQIDDESTLKDSMFFNILRRPDHPCNYIGLAKRALFKCFGLDSSTDSNHQHEKQE